jgi:hypothetical protein
MITQKFMGRGQLINRLSAQVGSREKAVRILQNRGHLMADGKTLTEEGKRRDRMTAEERSNDREAKKSGESANMFIYNPMTNTSKRKYGKG